jgi:hypothetical protein
MTLPPMPPRPDGPQCARCRGPRVAFSAGEPGAGAAFLPHGLRICPTCDMGAPHAGPPVLLAYIKRGHA